MEEANKKSWEENANDLITKLERMGGDIQLISIMGILGGIAERQLLESGNSRLAGRLAYVAETFTKKMRETADHFESGYKEGAKEKAPKTEGAAAGA